MINEYLDSFNIYLKKYMNKHVFKENIIIPSWKIIQNDSKIKKFYILPGILSIIFLSALLVYQSIYTYVEIFWKKEEALIIILNFFHSDYWLETIITWIIFIILYFILSPIFEWWLIRYIDNKNKDIETSNSDAIGLGIYKFFPLFEYNNIFSEFKLISILNGYLFCIRFIGMEYINIISYIFIGILFMGIWVNILFSYSKYYIVLENKWVFESIWKSARLSILNLKMTIRLYFVILFLNIRVIFNFLIFLSFPILIVLAIWLITSKIFLTIAITIISILFIIVILILWYLTTVLEIFTKSLWYFAYIKGKEKEKTIKNP